MSSDVIETLRDYYARRAAVYERVYFKPERQADLRAMEASLAEPFAGRHGLEIACGTGWWTPHAARRAASWLATDLNPETMDLARSKALPDCVQFATVDAYSLSGLDGRAFDAAFAGCWWSHVPLQRLPGWLDTLHARLVPGARVVMLDNRYVPTSSTPISRQDEAGNTFQLRTLDDGSVHEVLKNFPAAGQAFAMLGPRACEPEWTPYEHYWVLSYTLS
jgi:demethylmenaquinone methyltransferase/2-methoxy-6-polyprenyl-1,4-benzoquinol methylase